jgi:hypothetical protein
MRTLWTLIVLSLTGQVVTQEAAHRGLFEFAGPEASRQWRAENDGVMGGV